jgi:PPOX class probable F420-dependent enzyme
MGDRSCRSVIGCARSLDPYRIERRTAMAVQLTAEQRKLLDGKNFAFVATLADDGSPQVTPVWIEYDGKHVVFNTEQKRAKVRHMKRDPRISISIADHENPYHYIEIRGKVVEITATGAFEGIDRLAKKYIGQDKYPWNKPDDVRVVVKVQPEKVLGMGG